MTHSSLINALAQDIARLSQTLTAIAQEQEAVLMQETAAEQPEKKPTVMEPEKKPESGKAPVENPGADSSTNPNPITKEQIRELLVKKDREQVKSLFKELGVPKLSAIPKEKYPDVMAKAMLFMDKEV